MFFRSGDAVVESKKEKVMNLLEKLESIAKVLDKVQNHIEQPIREQLTQGFDLAGELYDSRCFLEDVKEDLQVEKESYEPLEKAEKTFPNGFTDWMETHHQVVEAITLNLSKERYEGEVKRRYDAQGRGGIWELAEELTDKFEKLTYEREWNGEYFDELEDFLTEELK
jgi:hypothetical protein